MSREYNYARKRGAVAGHHAEAKRDFRRIMVMLLIGGIVIGFIIHFTLIK